MSGICSELKLFLSFTTTRRFVNLGSVCLLLFICLNTISIEITRPEEIWKYLKNNEKTKHKAADIDLYTRHTVIERTVNKEHEKKKKTMKQNIKKEMTDEAGMHDTREAWEMLKDMKPNAL